jgi:formylmethanofuran dehydrogenase subunit E
MVSFRLMAATEGAVIARTGIAGLMVVLLVLAAAPARAETPEEWIKLGTRIHGGFGPLIPIGIRIGLDSLTRLKAEPRTVAVTYYSGEKAPCPCIADGVMIATQASPGQSTLQVMAEKAPPGVLASIVVRERKGSAAVRYTVKDEWLPKVVEWIKTLDPMGRYKAVMAAEGLFEVNPVSTPK